MVRRKVLYLFVLALVFLASCVSNKKLVFLQKDDIKKKNIPLDTVLRNYKMNISEYKIQPLDLLYIKVESLTPEDYDFITKMDPTQQNGSSGGGSGGAGGGGGGALALRQGYLVDTDGMLEYPVIGKVKVAGLTVFETQALLSKLFEPHLTLPVVRVRLLNFRFTILGEVNLEQQLVLTNTRVTLMEGIGMAGGLTDLANRQKVKIIRQRQNTSEVLYLDLLDENLITSPNYYIHQNDVIIIPPLKQRPFRKYFGQNVALVLTSLSTLLLLFTVASHYKN